MSQPPDPVHSAEDSPAGTSSQQAGNRLGCKNFLPKGSLNLGHRSSSRWLSESRPQPSRRGTTPRDPTPASCGQPLLGSVPACTGPVHFSPLPGELPDELVPRLGEQHLGLASLPSERGSPLVLLVLRGSMQPGHGRAEAGGGMGRATWLMHNPQRGPDVPACTFAQATSCWGTTIAQMLSHSRQPLASTERAQPTTTHDVTETAVGQGPVGRQGPNPQSGQGLTPTGCPPLHLNLLGQGGPVG